jgi:hypothetical protein
MENESGVKNIGLNTVFNNAMNWSFLVPVESLPDIEHFVGNYITVIVGGTRVSGMLKKISTSVEKEKGEIVAVYKKVDVLVNEINGPLSLPDKKDSFGVPFEIELDVM